MNSPPPPSDPALRVVVVGARRHHQGIGPHLARFVAEAGATVAGVVGTTDASADEAVSALARQGIGTEGGVDAAALVEAVGADALVVASPSATHDAYLRLGLDKGLHVLCEKPLCWGGDDTAARAEGYARAYAERGLHLVVNAQWPYTLDTYRELYPGVLDRVPTRFVMRLSPNSSGKAMLPDALPHALSLLLAVAPHEAPGLDAPRVRILDDDASRLEVSFGYRAGSTTIESVVELRRGREQPREAAYGFDGHLAQRRVDVEDYRLWMEGDGRRVALPDPTPRLVRAFLGRVSSSATPGVDPNAWPNMALLETIHAAWPHAKTT